jgi:hypothetical protein
VLARKLALWLLSAMVASLSALACNDQGGHLYTALNQSDRDVIVEVVTDDRRVLRLPAHTRGHLSASWSGPIEGWRLTIRDSNCAQLVSFSLKNEPPGFTLYVTAAGDIQLGSRDVFSFEGKDVELVSPLPPANCG